MKKMKIVSWNVNGIRAAERKGFVEWVLQEKPDIICIQETKAWPEQLSEKILQIPNYKSYWQQAERKGYSGVAAYCLIEPSAVVTDFGDNILSKEGRTLMLEFENFVLLNVYFPNGKKDAQRLKYKMDFYHAFLQYILELHKNGRKVIFCGDVNTAHKEIDLARPKQNRKFSGFLPKECAWLDEVAAKGFFDTFREFHDEAEQYSWWDMKSQARKRNVGWRIDYFFAHDTLKSQVKDGFIMQEVIGSDHCPIGIELDI